MEHAPATTLPSEDEPWWPVVEEFQRGLEARIRVLDWAGAEGVAREYLARAPSAWAAALFSSSLANALAAQGRRVESLDATLEAERLVPVDPYFKLEVARRLIAEYARPEDGLAKLAEMEPLLTPEWRPTWMSERALGLLELGRDAEAVEIFRELAAPERLAFMRTWDYIGLVDFRVVSRLIAKGLILDRCIAYLEAAEPVAARRKTPQSDVVPRLLAQAREAQRAASEHR